MQPFRGGRGTQAPRGWCGDRPILLLEGVAVLLQGVVESQGVVGCAAQMSQTCRETHLRTEDRDVRERRA